MKVTLVIFDKDTDEKPVLMTPLLFAAWVGFLLTFLNLLPAWQLDGGHMANTIFSKKTHTYATYASLGVLVLLGYWVMAALIFMLSRRNEGARPADNVTELDVKRKAAYVATLVLAALCAFLFGALASAIIVYAISLAYGITGSTNIAEVIQGFSNLDSSMLPLGLLSIALFIAGFGFKMGLVPFHMWLPDTYEGAPAPVTALLAAGTKKAGFAAALRVVIMGAVALSIDWTLALGIVAIMTMTVGNIAAIMQKNLSRMLAYSSIGHAGYILIGLAVAPFSPTGLSGSMLHIMNHAVMKGAAFIAVAGIAVALATTHLDKIKGLGRRMPITSIGLLVSMLALAGVPPLNGFWSKLMIFGGAIEAGSVAPWAPWLAIAGVLNSALSLAYYGWIIRKMYFEGESEKRISEPKSIIAVMIFSVIFMVGFGVYPDPLIQFAQNAAPVIGIMP